MIKKGKKKENKYDRRLFLKIAGTGVASAYAMSLPGFNYLKSLSYKRPNIIFILADDLGYGDLGCYGQKKIRTPNLDKMALEGIRFTSCYSGSSVCAPSRCSLMTGLHTGHCRIRGNFSELDHGRVPLLTNDVTIAQILKEDGYTTGLFGKWGLGEPDTTGTPNKKGFDHFFGYLNQHMAHFYYPEYLWDNDKKVYIKENENGMHGTYSQDIIFQKALEFLRSNKGNPFFLYLPFQIPHAEMIVPDNSLNEYKGKFPEKPFKYNKENSGGYHGQKYPNATYAGMITRMDKQIGELLKKLKEYEIDDNTIVFFSSDNGPSDEGGNNTKFFDSSGPLRGEKRSLYEGAIRVPMIVRYPGKIKSGIVSAHPWAFWDFLPTAAEIVGVKSPKEIDGISIVKALNGMPQKEHKYLYWEFEMDNVFKQAVRIGSWKAIRNDIDKPVQLYNLNDDLGEKIDISNKYPEVVSDAKKIFEEAHIENKNWPMRILPNVDSK